MATTDAFQLESLLGPQLLTKVGGPKKSTAQLFQGKELVLLYFSASWCPPCKAFSPILVDFYNAIAKEGKLEIVYISSDRTVPDFEGYYKKMPWLSIPAEEGTAIIKNNLAQLLGIQGIPTLIVLDAKTGEFISSSGREEVTRVAGDTAATLQLIDLWKTMVRRPLAEAASLVGGSQNPFMTIVMFFAKNPMAIFALLYGYKYLMRKWNATNGGGAVVGDEDVTEDVPDMGALDSEF